LKHWIFFTAQGKRLDHVHLVPLVTESVLAQNLVLMFLYGTNSSGDDIVVIVIENVDLIKGLQIQPVLLLKYALPNTRDIFHIEIEDGPLASRMTIGKPLRQIGLDSILKRAKNVGLDRFYAAL